MKVIMRTVVHKEFECVLMRENNMALVMTAQSAEIVVSEPTDEEKAVIESREPRVVFSKKWLHLMYVVLSTVVQSRDLKALVKRYEQSKDGRAAHIHALRVLETGEFYASSGLSTCMKNIISRTFLGKQDPSSFFADVQTHLA